VRLIDGLTDGSGWSSGKAPSPEIPEEIIIRLRERKAWNVSSVQISPATTLSYREIIAMLDETAMETLSQIKQQQEAGAPQGDLEALQRNVDRMKSAAHEAKKAAKLAGKNAPEQQQRAASAQAAKDVVFNVMTELGVETTCLDEQAYGPKDVSIFLGDFSGKLLPKPLFELSDEERKKVADPAQYPLESGWTHAGDYTLDRAEQNVAGLGFQDFAPANATHVLIQIKSNYGATRVKISEVRVHTDQAMPAQSEATAREVWPNVAALGYKPSVGWQFFAYLILTAAEIMVSITCLEFSYTQAPKKMKSFIMAVYLLSISLGNAFTALVNANIENPDGSTKLAGADYYWFFTIAMLVTAVLFIPIAKRYPVKNYLQDEAAEESSD
jgi:HPt (histidine-containing phosphotransfer) domain-containing protein